MGPVKELKEEHKLIKVMLLVLTEISRRLETGEAVKMEHLDQILEFIRVFLEECHQGKEEMLFFYAMEETGTSEEELPISLLLKEHQKGHQYIQKLAGARGLMQKSKSKRLLPVITGNARSYVELLTRHIEMEEGVLYPAAEKRISEKRQEQLSREFEILERGKAVPVRCEKFPDLVHHLKSIYLD